LHGAGRPSAVFNGNGNDCFSVGSDTSNGAHDCSPPAPELRAPIR
jgi:hypothetical protein